eukprot:12249933-Alexandrium_andersonii.AAC.1
MAVEHSDPGQCEVVSGVSSLNCAAPELAPTASEGCVLRFMFVHMPNPPMKQGSWRAGEASRGL